MPDHIECQADGALSLEEALEQLDAEAFDSKDEASLSNASVALKRLANNRRFLGDLLVRRLAADRSSADEFESGYSPQSIMLSGPRNGYFLRANIWPSPKDAIFRASGAESFVYGLPHDHNFDFLTVGYFGPGYRSVYYEYDYRAAVGNLGEKVPLRSVGESSLKEGKVQLYRAHRDIHAQIPPQSMSVSLNLVALNAMSCWYDQYSFDLANGSITGIINPNATESFLRIAIGLGGPEAKDLAEGFGRTHPSHRIRLACYEARANALADPVARDTVWAEAERMSGSLRVQREAARHRRQIESSTA